MPSQHSQRGWSFLVVLVALAIVAFLARESLLQYFGSATRAGAAGGDARLPPAARVPAGATQAIPAPTSAPVERARAVEGVVKQQVEALGRRIDDAPR